MHANLKNAACSFYLCTGNWALRSESDTLDPFNESISEFGFFAKHPANKVMPRTLCGYETNEATPHYDVMETPRGNGKWLIWTTKSR